MATPDGLGGQLPSILLYFARFPQPYPSKMRTPILPAFYILLLLFGSSTSATADFAVGKQAYGDGDYSTALRELKPLAESGHAVAQRFLGLMYQYGHGVSQNYGRAFKWYQLSAAQGDAIAQYNIAVMYDDGKGVPRDDAEAVKWYRLAAERGDKYAPANLAIMYTKGEGVNRDYVMAYMWWSIAALHRFFLADMDKENLAQNMTREQISAAEELLLKWLNKHGDVFDN
ncbi:MAG: tetratricopeptide repeat protein [Gammaproteobacteria bacterium]|nr:tetratricopeptide repeat protein [Gammaproteobacteria bacterium]